MIARRPGSQPIGIGTVALAIGTFVALVMAAVVLLTRQVEQTSREAVELSRVRLSRALQSSFERQEAALRAMAGATLAANASADPELWRRIAAPLAPSAPAASAVYLLGAGGGPLASLPESPRVDGVTLTRNAEFRRGLHMRPERLDAELLVLATLERAPGYAGCYMVMPLYGRDAVNHGMLVMELDFERFCAEALLPVLPKPALVTIRDEGGRYLYHSVRTAAPRPPAGPLVQLLPLTAGSRRLVVEMPASTLAMLPEYSRLTLIVVVLTGLLAAGALLTIGVARRNTMNLMAANTELEALEEHHRRMNEIVNRGPRKELFLNDACQELLRCLTIRGGFCALYTAMPGAPLLRLERSGGPDPVESLLAAGLAELPILPGWEASAALGVPDPVVRAAGDVLPQRLGELLTAAGFADCVELSLVSSRHLLGKAYLVSRRPLRDLPAQRLSTAQGLALTLGFALENAALFQVQDQRAQRLQQLQRVSRAVATNLNPEGVFSVIAGALGTSFGVEFSGIWLLRPQSRRLVLKAYHSPVPIPVEDLLAIPLDGPTAAEFKRVLGSRKPFNFGGGAGEAPRLLGHPAFQALNGMAVYPLFSGDSPLGVLVLLSRSAIEGEMDDILEALAHMATVAFQDAARYEDLSRANEQLAALSKHKSSFLATMSHELKTPLGAILGFSEVLQRDMETMSPERRQTFLDHIAQSARHLSQLITDILDHSKIESGTMSVNWETFGVREMIDMACSMVSGLVGRQQATISVECPEDLPHLRSDSTRFRQILVNLLSNAVKFSPAGAEVRVVVSPRQQGVPNLRVAVIDRGIGIKRENIASIFDEFRQLDESFSRRFEGTGLGLSLVRKLLELLGGTIEVESTPGKGSTFTFTLPWDGQSVSRAMAPKPISSMRMTAPVRISPER